MTCSIFKELSQKNVFDKTAVCFGLYYSTAGGALKYCFAPVDLNCNALVASGAYKPVDCTEFSLLRDAEAEKAKAEALTP